MDRFIRDSSHLMPSSQPYSSDSQSFRPQFTRPPTPQTVNRPDRFSKLLLDPIRKVTPKITPKVTPPEDKKEDTHTREEQLAAAKAYQSPLDQAVAYIDGWKSRLGNFEEPLFLHISVHDWAKCRVNFFSESDEAYPKISYDASTSMLIVQCMPTPLHESVSSLLAQKFGAMKESLPPDVRRTVTMTTGQDYMGFKGIWNGSQKRPDLAFERLNADGVWELKWVLETGFSEDYERLVQDVKLWLEGRSDVSEVILVKFEETPRYTCPVSQDDDLGALGIPPAAAQVPPRDFIQVGEYGPVKYKELTWVGTISKIYLEKWRKDASGTARKYGNRRNLLGPPNQVQFQLHDILDIPAATISLSLDDFQFFLKTKIKQLAVDRCMGMLNVRAKKEGGG